MVKLPYPPNTLKVWYGLYLHWVVIRISLGRVSIYRVKRIIRIKY
jgi:hypothetical protein